ncbi:2-succinylbenzoate--CoA ligase [subsurface metagenome]
MEACFATVKLGAIFVPLNFRVRQDELSYLVNEAEPEVLFVGSRYADMVHSARPQLPSVKRFVIIGGEHEGMTNYDELIGSGSPEEKTLAEVNDEDIAVLMFTAGTTGFPKGVPQDHNAYSSYVLSNVAPPRYGSTSRDQRAGHAPLPCGRDAGADGQYLRRADHRPDAAVRGKRVV